MGHRQALLGPSRTKMLTGTLLQQQLGKYGHAQMIGQFILSLSLIFVTLPGFGRESE